MAATQDGPVRPAGEAVPPGAALDHEPTGLALGRHRRRALGWAAGSGLVAVATVALAVDGTDRWWPRLVGVAVGLAIGAAVLLVRWRRMRQVLGAEPWVARRGHHEVAWWGRYRHGILVLEEEGGRPEVVCRVLEVYHRLDVLGADDRTVEVWVAGDPAAALAVAAPPGAADVVPVREARTAWGRRQLRRRALG